MMWLARKAYGALHKALNPVLVVWAVLVALYARYAARRFDVGLGPEPLINNVYHKRALLQAGYSAETFSIQPYFITQDFDRIFGVTPGLLRTGYIFDRFRLVVYCLARYRVLYIYFRGALPFATEWVGGLEPWLFRLARTRTVLLPYGGDVQDMSRSPNLVFKHAMSVDYPARRTRRAAIAARIDMWTSKGDHIVSGCEWVDYMYAWDTLTLAHFSIDAEAVRKKAEGIEHTSGADRPLRLLHAPNHRTIKGTAHLLAAVEQLQSEGLPIELDILEGVPNDEVIQRIMAADVVVDQLVIGWYAMFALEAMALGKPVICYIRPDLEALYIHAGLLAPDELPLLSADASSLPALLRRLIAERDTLPALGERGPRFVHAHHSLEHIGGVFTDINHRLGVPPSGSPAS